MQDFIDELQGGHPNSLGNTVAVVETVLADNARFEELFNCYFSPDEVVRLRTSNAMKRVADAQKALLIPYIDRFLGEITSINQPSVQWTIAQLVERLEADMTPDQIRNAIELMKRNLVNSSDWIVLNTTMNTLVKWSKKEEGLADWLLPYLDRLTTDPRKSVAGRAAKLLKTLKMQR